MIGCKLFGNWSQIMKGLSSYLKIATLSLEHAEHFWIINFRKLLTIFQQVFKESKLFTFKN